MVSLTKVLLRERQRLRMPLALRLALREFRGGIRGFGIFLGAIALGVAAITGVGSVSLSLNDGLAQQGRAILGGDVSFDIAQRELSTSELDFIKSWGRLSEVAQLRAMARNSEGDASLAEIKAADEVFPLTRGPVLDPALPLDSVLEERNGAFGIAADAALLGRLGLGLGGRLIIGAAQFEIRAVVIFEPDRLASGIRFGPPALISLKALHASGLLEPGSLVKRHYRVALAGNPASDGDVAALVEAAKEKFPEAGWDIRTRTKISPQFSRNLERFTEFLTLVGLTSLIVGGVGVANAIHGFVERKRQTIATLKSVGATGSMVFALMLTQAMLVALTGSALGAAIGAALPYIAASAFGSLIPFPIAPAIYPAAIGKGLFYGLLTALAFSAGPLGHAHDIPVQALFRAGIEPRPDTPRARYIALVLAAALCLVMTIFTFATDRVLVLIYTGATLAAFVLLRGASFLITMGARKVPHARHVAVRLAIGNIHRPGALTPSVVLSLGLGLALLVALTLIEGNIRAELQHSTAGETPSFYFLDVPSAKAESFASFLKSLAPDGETEFVPMLRGRIVKLNGVKASTARPKQSIAWVLEGDRGITFAGSVPDGSSIVSGIWWPKDYAGPPLVSLESEIADGLGLAIGDNVTVNVLGRDITAKMASTRKVNWYTFGINFVLVFSPNTFAGAPFNNLATLTFPGGSDAQREITLVRGTSRSFPSVTIVRVKDALDALNNVVGQLAIAVTGASSVAFLASILVLGGALAAGQNARTHDAVVLKTLGATRPRLLAAYIYEYSLIGVCTALFGVAAGSVAAFAIVRGVMDLEFEWFWRQALMAAAAAVLVTLLLGLLGTWRILGRKPAPYLRDL
ncbi:MAG: FtsX-like permease family protein [Beijerinckiaceae bacterium]|nr:FtsX-like permease family protein [Beijerinckiaceae bacterium]MCI0735712.1 FtsX-like permease family protein [Beijerinckiaceae bacterium]